MSEDALGNSFFTGPSWQSQFFEPTLGFHSLLVVDDVTAGPPVMGIRVASEAALDDCRRLARSMTLRNAVARLHHGGAAAILRIDGQIGHAKILECLQAFAENIDWQGLLIAVPDLGVSDRVIEALNAEMARTTQAPDRRIAIPPDACRAAGRGVGIAAEVAAPYVGVDLEGATVSIQGFGALGSAAARYLSDRGAVLVAVADSSGTVLDPDGIDVGALIEVKGNGGRCVDLEGLHVSSSDAVITSECDILLTAAGMDLVSRKDVLGIRARLVVQGATGGVTVGAEEALHARRILCIPDFVASAGGAVAAACAFREFPAESVHTRVDDTVRRNTAEVLERASRESLLPREAAIRMALGHIEALRAALP